MKILGIDPGYDRLGWGLLIKDQGTILFGDCGLITTSKNESHVDRLHAIFIELQQILQHQVPDIVIFESLFFSKNTTTALKVAEARGVIMIACTEASIKLKEVSPNQVKLSVTGKGNATKKEIEKLLRLQIKNIPSKLIDDTIDGLAIALTEAVTSY